jgi:hypothetical protein
MPWLAGHTIFRPFLIVSSKIMKYRLDIFNLLDKMLRKIYFDIDIINLYSIGGAGQSHAHDTNALPSLWRPSHDHALALPQLRYRP